MGLFQIFKEIKKVLLKNVFIFEETHNLMVTKIHGLKATADVVDTPPPPTKKIYKEKPVS
jgi:hypothetical protein